MLEHLCTISRSSEDTITISTDIVQKAIAKLKKNKAADIYGFCAEQLEMLPPAAYPVLADINENLPAGSSPQNLKSAYKLPFLRRTKIH